MSIFSDPMVGSLGHDPQHHSRRISDVARNAPLWNAHPCREFRPTPREPPAQFPPFKIHREPPFPFFHPPPQWETPPTGIFSPLKAKVAPGKTPFLGALPFPPERKTFFSPWEGGVPPPPCCVWAFPPPFVFFGEKKPLFSPFLKKGFPTHTPRGGTTPPRGGKKKKKGRPPPQKRGFFLLKKKPQKKKGGGGKK